MGFISDLLSLIFDKDEENEQTRTDFDEYESDDSEYDEYEDTNDDDDDFDEEDEEDDDVKIPESLQRKYEKALEKFYGKLSVKEMEDEDLSNMLSDLDNQFWEGKIQDPSTAINKVYQAWKSTKVQRKQQKSNNRVVIVDMLRRYDELSEEERESLIEYDSKYCLRHLKSSERDAVSEIIKSWYDAKSLTDEKFEIINGIKDSGCYIGDCDPYRYEIDKIPLTKDDYRQRLVIFKNDGECENHDRYADYFQRYWLETGEHPEPITCDDLIVNRPCYMKTELLLVSPHFRMGQRQFSRDSFQEVTAYLFADSLEYLADGGHYVLPFATIIELKMNNWEFISMKARELRIREECRQTIREKDIPDPKLFEITCRNSNKTLFSFDSSQAKVDLLILRALIYYFIKNPQANQSNN